MSEAIAEKIEPFAARLSREGLTLRRGEVRVLQVNVGKLCNQTCRHCHVEAGPRRKEIMADATAERILEVLGRSRGIEVVDITGGAPELTPCFRRLVEGARELDMQVIDRHNLTVQFEPGQEDLAEFLREHEVAIVASLPCYTSENVDKQRGNGVFEKSIAGLRALNDLGYGREGGPELDLVYNPLGPSLPPPQAKLEADYKHRLREDFGIEFTRLFTITNMPIRRFLWALERAGELEQYMELLVQNFNAGAARGVMCRELLSVDWRGELYDCDFNQMIELPVAGRRTTIWDVENFEGFAGRGIAVGDHCYGCTAGAGSSCTGATTS